MTRIWMVSGAGLLHLAPIVLALQVSPNSPCASVCLDNSSLDPSDPNSSNTLSTDVICLDASYNTTVVGQKYKSCMSCLQTSSATSSGESDQAWFIYNARYTLSSCLFRFNNVTDAVDTPCSTSSSCGPLQQAVETGNLVASNASEFSYCTEDGNAMLGEYLPKCISCLRNGGSETYLSNLLVALQAGCIQQPPAGVIIGMDGSVFSDYQVNITSPGDNYTVKTTIKKKGLSQGAVIGIAVALGILLLASVAVLFVCYRRRKAMKRARALKSPLDSRFGAANITSPNSGAYGNPYAHPPVNASQPFTGTALSAKELRTLSGQRSITKSQISEPKDLNTWQEANNQPPVYSPSQIPTHQAYIPTSPVSPHTAGVTLPNYASSTNNSPYPPPSLHSIPPSRMSPQYSPTTTIISSINSSPTYIPPPPPPRSQTAPPASLNQQHIPLAQYSPPSTQQAQRSPPPLNTNVHSRALSRNGLGNATLASATSMEVPVVISGPLINHGRRFDFELADQERRRREQEETQRNRNLTKKPSWSPESEPEQWPGSY